MMSKMKPEEFLLLAKKEPITAEKKIIEFASRLKEKASKGEISLELFQIV
jgi:hypothetical protein